MKKDTTKYNILKLLAIYGEISETVLKLFIDSDLYARKILGQLKSDKLIKRGDMKLITGKNIRYNIHPCYLTPKGKSFLYENFPDDFPWLKNFESRKMTNEGVERIQKVADSILTCHATGAKCLKEDKPPLFKNKSTEKLGTKKEDLGTLKDEVTSYKDLAEYKDIKLQSLLKFGVVYSADEIKSVYTLTTDDVNHWRFTAVTGLLLTEHEPFCLYNAGYGYTPWQANGEKSFADIMSMSLAREYNFYPNAISGIKNSMMFCKNKRVFKDVIMRKFEKNKKANMQDAQSIAYEKVFLIPMSKDGISIIKDKIRNINYLLYLDKTLRANGYKENENYKLIFPYSDEEGTPLFMGLDFELNTMRKALKLLEDKEYEECYILCYKWQKEYYETVFPENTTYLTINSFS